MSARLGPRERKEDKGEEVVGLKAAWEERGRRERGFLYKDWGPPTPFIPA